MPRDARHVDEGILKKIDREPLRRRVSRILMDWVVSGRIKPSTRFKESELAEQLGVSRTPLREALIELEQDGLAVFEQGRGFSVRPFDLDRAEELFEMVGFLEGLALRISGQPKDERLRKLREVNNMRLSESDSQKQVELDVEWHQTLVARCDNRELLKILSNVRRRIYRYEYAFMGDEKQVEGAIRQHQEIIEALEAGNMADAVDSIRNHWYDAFRGVAEILQQRDA